MTRREEAEKPENSSMAKDEQEMNRLGKEMETMKTNKQVKEKGQQPDPQQHESQ